jgi:hypothetical protein
LRPSRLAGYIVEPDDQAAATPLGFDLVVKYTTENCTLAQAG